MPHHNKITLFALLTLPMLCGCASDSVVDNDHTDPTATQVAMNFGLQQQDVMTTRAASSLESHYKTFSVACYKDFGTNSNQTVMNNYQVNYNTVDLWHYEGRQGDQAVHGTEWTTPGGQDAAPLYQTQYTKYWDMDAFPYDFCAVAPFTDKLRQQGHTITLPSEAGVFSAQTCTNGTISAGSEPYLFAHLERQKTGMTTWTDIDKLYADDSDNRVIKTFNDFAPREDNNNAAQNNTVNLRFHHIMSKIGFRLYISDTELDADTKTNATLTEMRVKVPQTGYLSSASNYAVTLDADKSLLEGTFSTKQTEEAGYYIIKNQLASPLNLITAQYTTKNNSYDLQCPDGLTVLPQKVEHLEVSFVIGDRWFDIDIEDLKWEPNTYYIYMLNITDMSKRLVTVSEAKLKDWDDISGTLDDITLEKK